MLLGMCYSWEDTEVQVLLKANFLPAANGEGATEKEVIQVLINAT